MIDRLKIYIAQPISIAPLVLFRGAFGLLMLFSLLRFTTYDWIEQLYIEPAYLFSYFGFDFLPRPSAFGVKALFAICALSAIGITLGAFYRWSAVLFFGSFVYIELLDKANYLNHYYFVSWVALVMIFLPAHRAFSLDVLWGRVQACGRVMRANVFMLQILIGGLYFMAGVAKLNSPWLLEALPMRIWLPPHATLPIIGPLLDELWVAYLFSWIGAIYDLSILFLLYNKSTRKFAFLSVVLFHGLTAALFPIGMFPYVMICSSLIFFAPDSIERVLSMRGTLQLYADEARDKLYRPSQFLKHIRKIGVPIILFFLFLFPMRFLAYPGNLYWHEQGYRFSWRVMLMEKAGHCFFYVKDPAQAGEKEIDNLRFLTPNQEKQMSTQPDMILQYAQLLDAHYRDLGISDPIVRAEAWVTLNGSGSRLFIDPFVDLSAIDDSWAHKEWVIPYDSVITVSDLRMIKAERFKTLNN